MTTRLTQKHVFKGTQAFEIDGAELKVRRKSPFRPAVDSRIPLAALGSEPLLTPTRVSFVSRASGQVLVSLAIGKPDAGAFNEFLNELKARVSAASGAAQAQWVEAPEVSLNGNLTDVPPEFAEGEDPGGTRIRQAVRRDELEQAIEMLRRHLDDPSIEPFVEALEDLRSEPTDEARLDEVARRFDGLGIGQGAVLTYAPYIGFLMSDHPFVD